MANVNTIASRYIARGLALIRAANSMGRDIDALLLKLANDIRYLLARGTLSDLGKRALNALLSDIADAVFQRYNDILDDQNESLRELIGIEAEFAQKAGDYNNKPSDGQLAGVFAGLLILGSSLKDLWRKQAADLVYKTSAAIKAASRAESSNETALSTIFGQARRRGQTAGVMGTARRYAATSVQTAAQTASQDARVAAFRANGVKYIEWVGVLDAAICPRCLERHGRLWTIDGQPFKHDLSFSSPPLHMRCRCFLLPFEEVPSESERITSAGAFEAWFRALSPRHLDQLFGAGRADLYRRGVITWGDMVDQNGQSITLAELRRQIDFVRGTL